MLPRTAKHASPPLAAERSGSTRRLHRGYTAIDVLVVLILIGLFAMVLLMAIPRGREAARLAACQRNLSQIGMALALYDQTQKSLPMLAELTRIEPPATLGAPGPLKTLLQTFGLPDFLGLSSGVTPPASGPVPGEIPVPGFVCPSDPRATAGTFRAPISYRAATGGDSLGCDGVFVPGRRIALSDVEQADGASYTAAFAERLVGDGIEDHLTAWNHAVVAGRLPSEGCSLVMLKARGARWHGDAGSSWVMADYRSTLYNHSLAPNAPLSCLAADGQSAFMGASSGHVRGVNCLILDGSVRLILPSIAPPVWTELASLRPAAPATETSPAEKIP